MNVALFQLRVRMVMNPIPVVHTSAPLLETLEMSGKF